MASDAQLRANGENAKKSSGPRTESGKKRSRKNALRHGLFSEHFFVDNDEQDAFAALLSELEFELKPVGPLEVAFVERIAVALWRQRRLNIAEGASIRLNQREEKLNHQLSLAPFYGRMFPGQRLASSRYSGQLARAEKDAAWIAEVRREIGNLSEPTVATIKATAPKTYAYLEKEAEQFDQSPEDYLGGLVDGPEEFIEDIRKFCADTMKQIEEARAEASFRHELQMRAIWPQSSDLLARYQTMIDNQLYKALQEYRQLQDRRLKTIDVEVEAGPKCKLMNGSES